MLKCKIYHCATRDSWSCCAECDEEGCPNRCLNHPDRCKCVSDGRPTPKKHHPHKHDHVQILTLAKSGYTNTEIMEKLGCSRSTVTATLRRAGFKRVGWGKEALHE